MSPQKRNTEINNLIIRIFWGNEMNKQINFLKVNLRYN